MGHLAPGVLAQLPSLPVLTMRPAAHRPPPLLEWVWELGEPRAAGSVPGGSRRGFLWSNAVQSWDPSILFLSFSDFSSLLFSLFPLPTPGLSHLPLGLTRSLPSTSGQPAPVMRCARAAPGLGPR